MSLPKKTRVLGKSLSVSLVRDLTVEGRPSSGVHVVSKSVIAIKSDLGDMERQDTLLHEVLHSIDAQLRLRLRESQIHPLAAALLGWMKDNPGTIRWFLSKDKTFPIAVKGELIPGWKKKA